LKNNLITIVRLHRFGHHLPHSSTHFPESNRGKYAKTVEEIDKDAKE
jgi:hypothetical protein